MIDLELVAIMFFIGILEGYFLKTFIVEVKKKTSK